MQKIKSEGDTMSKKIFLSVLVLCILLMHMCICAGAEDGVDFDISTTVAGNGVTVEVVYTGVGMCSGTLDLMYLPETAVPQGFEPGDALADCQYTVNKEYAENCIRINWSRTDGMDASGCVGVFAFELADETFGRQDISVYSLRVTDSDGNRIKADIKNNFTSDRITADFADVTADSWYYDAVIYTAQNGLMNGVAEGVFNPDGAVTRAMLVTILHRMEGEPEADRFTSFADVPSGGWYADAVQWAASKGIVNGVTATDFAPEAQVTREQTAAILYRYADYCGIDTATDDANAISAYSDFGRISEYAFFPLAWITDKGIMTGVSATQLSPGGSSTRAQIATVLERFLKMSQ